MTTQTLTSLTGKELMKKLMAGERDFSNTRIAPGDAMLALDPDYPALLSYLRGQDLRTTPIKAEHVDWRSFNAPGMFLEFSLLAGSDFSGAILTDASMRRVDCTGVNFRGANLSRAAFTAARLPEADFSGATATDCDFYESNLAGAKFRNCNLSRSYVIRTSLKDVDVVGANFGDACFYRLDLRGANGLDQALELGTAKLYRTIMTAKEQAIMAKAAEQRPSVDLRAE